MDTQYTLKETINLIEDRISITKKARREYCELYKEKCRVYDIEQAEKYYRFMQEEHAVLIELEYLLKTITGKEND